LTIQSGRAENAAEPTSAGATHEILIMILNVRTGQTRRVRREAEIF
jgi:hypothetical protein